MNPSTNIELPSVHAAARKLASSAGASIVFALGVFAFAAIFCVTIVSIALSSAENAINQVADEQDFLAASSAAKLLQEVVPDNAVTFKNLSIPDPDSDSDPDPDPDDNPPTCTASSGRGGARPVLQAMGESLLPTGADGKRESKTVALTASNEEIPDVSITMVPAKDADSFDVTALVKGEKGNTIAVAFRGDPELEDNEVLSVTWEVESVGK